MSDSLITRKDHNHNMARHYNYQKDFNDLVTNFLNGWNDFPLESTPLKSLEPKIEISENEKNVTVLAEMPGINEKDIDMEISSDGYLTIAGEKKHETKEEKKGNYFSEISYGSFSRTIPLPWDLQYNEAKAEYTDGVLSIIIPKSTEEQCKKKKITITHK